MLQASPQTASATLRGKVAVVTGASRGIGAAVVTALDAAGCDLALAARYQDPKLVQRSAARLQSKHLIGYCDVRDETSVERFFERVKETFGRIDFLINNAGISGPAHKVQELPLALWQEVISTNLTGMFLTTRAALPLMSRGATIVNNLSISARQVFAGFSAYSAAKFGALGLTNTLREELRERGIRVIALLPGATDTEIWNQFWPDAPRQRMMQPDSIAAAVVHALSLPPEATVEEIVIAPTGGPL